MPFPGTSRTLAQGWTDATGAAYTIREQTVQISAASAAGPINRERVVNFMRNLGNAVALWQSVAGMSGIVDFARGQLGEPARDIAAEFTAMVNAAQALQTWIFTNFPKDGASGAWLVQERDADGQPVALQFTTAQLASFRTNCDAFAATIEIVQV